MALTKETVQEILDLEKEITAGPWVSPDGLGVRNEDRDNWRTVCRSWMSGSTVEQSVNDLCFIAEVRNVIVDLCKDWLEMYEMISSIEYVDNSDKKEEEDYVNDEGVD